MCILTNERYKTYQKGLLFCDLGHAPGLGLGGAGGQILVLSEHGYVANQIKGGDE